MDKNQVAEKFTPLVHKIARQMHSNCVDDYNDLISIGYEGLMYAVDRYTEDSTQTFLQYSSYMIRFHILNYLNSGDTKIIKMSSSVEKRERAKGRSINITSLDCKVSKTNSKSEGLSLHDAIPGDTDIQIYNSLSEDVEEQWCVVFRELEKVFTDREITIFYKRFGLAGWDTIKGVEIAKEYGITSVIVTCTCNKIIKYMKKNPKMMNILLDIQQKTNV